MKTAADPVVAGANAPSATAGTLLICDGTAHPSALLQSLPAAESGRSRYLRLITGVLEKTSLRVVFSGEPGGDTDHSLAAVRELLIEGGENLPSEFRARLQIVAAPVAKAMLPSVDLLVALDPPILLHGCWAGLKPVQIGHALIGTQKFSHVFPDAASFVEQLANCRLRGQLTLDEYAGFQDFCQVLSGAAGAGHGGEVGALAAAMKEAGLRRDPVLLVLLRELARRRATPVSAWKILAGALANPFAAARLLMASLLPGKRNPGLRPIFGPNAGTEAAPRAPAQRERPVHHVGTAL